MFPRFLRCERGVTAIEYAMIAALIAVVLVAAVRALGGTLKTTFNHIEAALPQFSGSSGHGNGNGNNGNGNGNGGANGNGNGGGNGNGNNGNGNGNGG